MSIGSPTVLIIGAGMSGICAGVKLKNAGIAGFTIVEKDDRVGGTWRDNVYPGLTCDVPAVIYQYSFATNPEWSHFMVSGAEIGEYVERVVDRFELRPHLRFGEEVVSAQFLNGRWQVRTRGESVFEVDFLISATGFLHHPNVPKLSGLDTFAGQAFHSVRWDASVDLAKRRVAIIGSGSTGVQLVDALAGEPRRLLLFQRTAQWVFPVRNWRTGRITKALRRRFPAVRKAEHRLLLSLHRWFFSRAAVESGWRRNLIVRLCQSNLRAVVDPVLRRKLTPGHAPMCKRIVMASGYYRAVQHPSVEVITEPIDHVQPDAIVTADGVRHEVDVLVLATGFNAHAYLRPIELTGLDGQTLSTAWRDGPRAYQTVALPGFPNFFMLIGPHSPVGHSPITVIAEAQADFAVRWIEAWRRGEFMFVSPTRTATDVFNRRLRAQMPNTVWVSGCRSWYLDESGVPNLWPWRAEQHTAALGGFDPGDFEMR